MRALRLPALLIGIPNLRKCDTKRAVTGLKASFSPLHQRMVRRAGPHTVLSSFTMPFSSSRTLCAAPVIFHDRQNSISLGMKRVDTWKKSGLVRPEPILWRGGATHRCSPGASSRLQLTEFQKIASGPQGIFLPSRSDLSPTGFLLPSHALSKA